MIDRLIEFSVRHRAAVVLAALVLGGLGAYAAAVAPVDAIPDLSENQVIVFTDWPGHSPREVEDQVTYPLTLSLQGVRGVKVVRSSSEFNFSMIGVIFDDSVDFPTARLRVAERLARASAALPPGVAPAPVPDAVATGQIFWYTVEGGGLDLGRLRDIQDWYVRPQLASVPGVAEVASAGGYPVEYQVNVDPFRLRSRGATLADVVRAAGEAHATVGGHVLTTGNAEFVVRGAGWLGTRGEGGRETFDPTRAVRDLEDATLSVRGPDGAPVRVADVATVAVGPGPRRGVLEKDGNEVTGGVVLMSYGENPLEVTRRLKAKIRELQAGLPPGVRIVPFYDRTPLIRGAVGTVTNTVVEAVLTSTLCVLVILMHLRASFVIALTIPLAVLASFALLGLLRALGVADVQTNVMSLSGLAISVGVLVDSSIVMVENAMHHLRLRFGDRPVRGDVRAVVLPAFRAVGRPIFFSVVIMLLSFLPVFALGGMEGRMFRPLAFTKSFALVGVAALSVTLVPALCTVFLKGRMRGERESPLVRGVIDVYRPVLASLLDRPAPIVWVTAAVFVVGLAPVGNRGLWLAALGGGLVAVGLAVRRPGRAALAMASLVLVGLAADRLIEPLGREFLTPLDEGMVMDMPITVPRASVAQAADDLKARDMVLCRFPEVDMVVGKAGRAETTTDPAPIDMIETMVNFRPRELWPRRKLLRADAARQARAVLGALARRGLVVPPGGGAAREAMIGAVVDDALPHTDVLLREYAYQHYREFDRDLGGAPTDPDDPDFGPWLARWRGRARRLDDELVGRAAGTFTRLAIEAFVSRAEEADPKARVLVREAAALRDRPPLPHRAGPTAHHHAAGPPAALKSEPVPALDSVQEELSRDFASRLVLWRVGRSEMVGFGGELDRAVSMPGWTNVWTMPIQNRVDMLATGVNTAVGVRVLGRRLDDVVTASEAIAAVLKRLPGASDVVADPVRGKGYLEIRVDRTKAARAGVSVAEVNRAVETALGGTVVATTVEGRERHAVRVRYARDHRQDADAVRSVLIAPPPKAPGDRPGVVPLGDLADVTTTEGPASIKSENGMLRNYVRLNVRGGDAGAFVREARAAVAREARLPDGVFVEWTGRFEHEQRARARLAVVVPLVVLTILLVLWWTYHDLADAALMMLAVPGAVAGGVFFQWLFGEPFSVTVWVGYIACFGMATSTGIIMLVYLREAVANAGGLSSLNPAGLRAAVLDGAVHRLRPKLLTEGTIILGLAPMVWSSGVGAEVIRPMAAPVLGGILVADEVIDLLLPVAFYHVRLRRLRRLGVVDEAPAALAAAAGSHRPAIARP